MFCGKINRYSVFFTHLLVGQLVVFRVVICGCLYICILSSIAREGI